jgi:transposase
MLMLNTCSERETELGIELLGPVPSDSSWQQKAKLGFELSCFTVDWEHRQATCPQGHVSQSWHQRSDNYGNPVIQVRFRRPDCAGCPVRSQCTHSPYYDCCCCDESVKNVGILA